MGFPTRPDGLENPSYMRKFLAGVISPVSARARARAATFCPTRQIGNAGLFRENRQLGDEGCYRVKRHVAQDRLVNPPMYVIQG